jgi:hypothetical protein
MVKFPAVDEKGIEDLSEGSSDEEVDEEVKRSI